MTARRATARPQKHRAALDDPIRPARWRAVLAGAVVVSVLGGGLVIGFGGFLGRPSGSGGVMTMRSSMAGFDPKLLVAKPGQILTIDWWNQDNAMHLDGGGVHTFIAPELGINEKLPAASRRTIQITAPTTAGDYDFYCDTCCGGKESPTMHGTLRVRSA